jgi:DNA helicase-2/ATP-dependent DNA helicase PcrA
VRVLTFDTGLDEADLVVRRIKDAVSKQEHAYRDVAIFLRMNALTRTLESAFVKHGVPFQIVKGLAFFDRKENKDVVAYLRLIVNPQDQLSFLRVVNEPPRGIGKMTLERLQAYAETREISLLKAASEVNKITEIKGKSAKSLFEFAVMIAELRQHLDDAPDALMSRVLDRTGYRDMLKSSADADDQDRLANIEELITAAKQFVALNPDAKLGDFLEQITLASDVDSYDEQSDCVSVMTLHAAKGLEFPVVYLLAVEQGILPHERSLQRAEEVEEERRLCFVGMTRAKQQLHLCHAKLREFRGQALYTVPSMFFDELHEDAVERLDLSARSTGNKAAELWRSGGGSAAASGWNDTGLKPIVGAPAKPDERGYAVGVNVQHEVYGKGRIIDMSGTGALRKLRIRFATAGEKSFIADKVKLKVLA